MIASIVIGLVVLLIVYWWANAGAWSAFLHMLCVVMAGALAFALWEPVAYLMVSGSMSNYALGVTLLGLFLVLLVIMRLAMDRLVPANLQLPRSADVLVGAGFGAVSGVLTMGVFVIGCGFIQSTARIGDLDGWMRRSDVPKAPTIGSDNAPLLHIADLAANFYGYLSWGAFTPWGGGGTLGTHQPDLTRTALSLHRDSYGGGTARTGLNPASVTGISAMDIASVQLDAGAGAQAVPAIAVQFTVDQDAYDGDGQQFVLSASQARIVGAGDGGTAAIAYPMAWVQTVDNRPAMYYFNSPGNYATTKPGEGQGTFVLLFPKSELKAQAPRYLQLKGMRFPITQVTAVADISATLESDTPVRVSEDPGIDRYSAQIDAPEPAWSLPISINVNDKGNLSIDGDNYIIRGVDTFPHKQTSNVSESLRVRGFKAAEGTRIVRMDASAVTSGARIWPELNEWVREAGAVAQDSRIALVDSNGTRFYCIAYAEDNKSVVNINATGGSAMRLRDVPIQSLGNDTKLLLYFRVPTGVTIKYLALDGADGLRAVNTLDFLVPEKR